MEYPIPRDGDLPSKTTPKRLRSELTLLALFIVVTFGILLLCTRALASAVPVVRVMVDREPRALRINGFDLLVTEADTSRKLVHQARRASLELRCSLGGRMTIDSGDAKSWGKDVVRASGPVKISSLGGFLRVGSGQYRDEIYVYSFNGQCVAVNHVDLEQYVAGVVDSEMSPKWGMQTLMAQAIAARTYAIYQMREAGTTRFRGLDAPFDVDSSVKDQVYDGARRETYKSERVIQLTRGQVLTFDGRPIKAFYHSTCGGHTETPERVWGLKMPYLRSVECEYCRTSPRYNWVYSITAGEIERRLNAQGLLRGRLLGLSVVDRNLLGRASRIEVRGAQGTTIVSATKLRELVGNVSLRSTDFSIAHNPDGGVHGGDYVFIGHGSGHGVGMCQWGAKTMGDLGYNYDQILGYYYPAAKISKLY